MKPLFLFTCVLLACTACSKKDITEPAAPAIVSNTIFYRDNHIAVSNMSARQSGTSAITISFSTLYEVSIQKLELMSGNDENQLCTIHSESINNNSNTVKNYEIIDEQLKGNTMYYMLRYTLNDGSWGYTPLYEIDIS